MSNNGDHLGDNTGEYASEDARDDTEAPARRTSSRVVLIGVVVPLAVTLVATILMFGWLPELPDPIAVHWSGAGADGFGPAVPFILIPAIITVLFSGFALGAAWRLTASGRLIWNQKIMVVMSVWLAAFVNIGFALSVHVQRGLTDAHNAPDISWSLALGAGIGLVLAAAGWFVLPAGESKYQIGIEPSPVDAQGAERVSWSHSARLGTRALLIVGGAILIGLVAVAFAAFSSPESTVLGIIVIVVVSVLAITSFWWHVSADQRGFTAKGLIGWPRKRIRLENISAVKVVDVNPISDFGGWGWRWAGDGRSGIILSSGPGIEVTQKSGKCFIVTVDDAETGAGVLAALVATRVHS